jgi:hypothetical protein
MDEPLVDRVNFAKIVTVLAIVFGISVGMCGLTAVFSARSPGGESMAVVFGIIELVAMGLSALGLVVTVIVWVIALIFKGRGAE